MRRTQSTDYRPSEQSTSLKGREERGWIISGAVGDRDLPSLSIGSAINRFNHQRRRNCFAASRPVYIREIDCRLEGANNTEEFLVVPSWTRERPRSRLSRFTTKLCENVPCSGSFVFDFTVERGREATTPSRWVTRRVFLWRWRQTSTPRRSSGSERGSRS